MPFASELVEAEGKAQPHWDAAAQAAADAKRLRGQIQQIEVEINDLFAKQNATNAKTLEGIAVRKSFVTAKQERETKLVEEMRCRERAKDEKTQGDLIYWPVFNLDRKNPSAKPDIEHLPPEQLVESILEKERKIAAIVSEIRDLLKGGKA